MKSSFFILFLCLFLSPPIGLRADTPLLIFAAASTREPLEAAIDRIEAETGLEIQAVFAGSSTLARQIEAGAPADLYLSASPIWTDYLLDRGVLSEEALTPLFSNRLALVTSKANPLDIDRLDQLPELLKGQRIAIANPDHVPAGLYAKEAFEQLGLWDLIKDKLAPAQDVRRALAFAERGAAPLAVVYQSDAQQSDGVELQLLIPKASHRQITYSLALLSPDKEAAQAVFASIKDKSKLEPFWEAGFTPLDAP